jgi:hypothetical protein
MIIMIFIEILIVSSVFLTFPQIIILFTAYIISQSFKEYIFEFVHPKIKIFLDSK